MCSSFYWAGVDVLSEQECGAPKLRPSGIPGHCRPAHFNRVRLTVGAVITTNVATDTATGFAIPATNVSTPPPLLWLPAGHIEIAIAVFLTLGEGASRAQREDRELALTDEDQQNGSDMEAVRETRHLYSSVKRRSAQAQLSRAHKRSSKPSFPFGQTQKEPHRQQLALAMLRTAAYRGAFAHAMKTGVAKSSSAASAFPVLRLSLAGAKQSSSSSHTFLKAMQSHAFATIPSKDDGEQAAADASPKKTFEELLEENEALRKEVADLKEKVKNKPGKFMSVISQFGVPFLIWWTTLYVGTGAALYVAFDTGIIAGADAIKFIMDLGLDRFIDVNTLNPTYGNIALAAVLNECLEPLRFPLALATIPTIKRIFSKKAPEEIKQ